MAKTTATRASRNLKPEATIEAEAATEAQKAAREANSASIVQAVRDVIGDYYSAEQAVTAAQATLNTKLESAYVSLAKLAHDNELDAAMCRDVLTTAIEHYYGKGSTSIGLSTATKLRSQLLRAMQPKVRENVPAIIKAWNDAWDNETKAIAADPKTPKVLRAKFDNRDGAITQALSLAQGKAGSKTGKGAVPSVVVTKPADVVSWVKAHPRQSRGATTPVAKTDGTVTGDARTQAIARVEHIVELVKALQSDYPVALDTIQPVLDALTHVTGDKLVPSRPAAPKAPPAEPIAGAAQLDAAIDPQDLADAIAAIKMLRAK